MKPITVTIVDDHQIFRNGLITSMSPFYDIQIISDFAHAADFLLWLKSAERLPEIVITDMKMVGMNGIELTKHIVKNYPEMSVIGLSVYENHVHTVNMFKAGASAYLLKDTSPYEIAQAIRSVIDRGYYFNQIISMSLLKNILSKEKQPEGVEPDPDAHLSEHEEEILKLICAEYTSVEIADKLYLSIKTVNNYRSRLFMKTKTNSTVGLVMYAIRKGYHLV
jgi:DNA-binding NarL/FixJ family response regulator